jgi:hypothetical protein
MSDLPSRDPVRALYASMATKELERLRAAFEGDVRTAKDTIAFGEGRLVLIAEELKTRAESDPANSAIQSEAVAKGSES